MHYIKQFHKNSKIFQWKRKEKHKKDFLFKSQAPRDHGNEVNGTIVDRSVLNAVQRLDLKLEYPT